jgi:hypothetical protein
MNPATMNVKAAVAALMAELPKEPGPDRQKALAEWLEARIHLNFTEMADYMFGDGYLTREERIALSGLIGDALDLFHEEMVASEDLQGVRTRQRWEPAPVVVMPQDGPAPVAVVDSGEMAAKARALLAERRRRVLVARRQLELVG